MNTFQEIRAAITNFAESTGDKVNACAIYNYAYLAYNEYCNKAEEAEKEVSADGFEFLAVVKEMLKKEPTQNPSVDKEEEIINTDFSSAFDNF